MPLRNIALLTKIRDQIKNHPETHEQDLWLNTDMSLIGEPVEVIRLHCGTQACVAGWAAVLSDVPVVYQTNFGAWVPPDGKTWSEYGVELLGLSGGEAALLFDGSATHDSVLDMLEYLIDHPDATTWESVEHLDELYVSIEDE